MNYRMIIRKILLFSTITSVSFGCKCCQDCCKKLCSKTDDSEEIKNEDIINFNNTDLGNHLINQPTLQQQNEQIKPLYDLNKQIDLNNINLENDLENVFIQLLSERLYDYMVNCSCTNILVQDTNIHNPKQRKLNLNKQPDDGILQQVCEILKTNRSKLFFKNITLIDKQHFDEIENDYIKLLATFFLEDQAYEEYFNNYLSTNNNNVASDIMNNTNQNADMFKQLREDENFLQLLGDHEATNIVLGGNNVTTVSNYLKQCPPYNGKTYRGTHLYDEYGELIDIKEENVAHNLSLVSRFVQLIRACQWQEPGLKPYSSDEAIAGFFAMQYQGYNNNFLKFRILIRNHVNKTGVDLLNFYDETKKDDPEYPLYGFFPNEKEVLFPEGSKFKIFGMRISQQQTYDINKKIKYFQPFIVLDVVQIE